MTLSGFTIYSLRRRPVGARRSTLRVAPRIFLALLAGASLSAGCSQEMDRVVIVYTSQDQVYAEPILREFTRQTGIKVRAVYDSEAVKTVGLANRLLAERDHPQCDVFWNNEELRTRRLAAQKVFRETEPWRAVGFRSRRVVINTNHLAVAAAPGTLMDLTNSIWRKKVALAYPLLGTTATHFVALRQHWNETRWTEWCRGLVANQALLVDGNSVVVQLVGRGEAWVGLTDSDDVAAGRREGWPVVSLPATEESLLIPNTVGVIRNAPHPHEAQQLFEYLQRPEVVERLIQANALEGKSVEASGSPGLKPNWDALPGELDAATAALQTIFLR